MYYEQDLSQQAIADELQISRSNISRLLKEAKDKGVVEIHIRKPLLTSPALENELQQQFGLDHAMVVQRREKSDAEVIIPVGLLAARYVESMLRPADLIAISWGISVHAAVKAMTPNPALHVDVVQMLGSVGTVDAAIDGHELARRLATKLGGRFYFLHSPLFVDSPVARNMFMEQPTIRETLSLAKRTSIALVGVGTTESAASSFLRTRHLTEEQLQGLRDQGVVGEIGGIHFGIDGNPSLYEINNRVISIGFEDLRRIPTVIAIACSTIKRRAILGALASGTIRVLATDDVTAAAVLREASLRR